MANKSIYINKRVYVCTLSVNPHCCSIIMTFNMLAFRDLLAIYILFAINKKQLIMCKTFSSTLLFILCHWKYCRSYTQIYVIQLHCVFSFFHSGNHDPLWRLLTGSVTIHMFNLSNRKQDYALLGPGHPRPIDINLHYGVTLLWGPVKIQHRQRQGELGVTQFLGVRAVL